MKAKNATVLSAVICLASAVTLPTSHAIGIGPVQPSTGIIHQRVENRADRLIERAAERRAQPSLPTRAVNLPQLPPLPSYLPDRIDILATDNSSALVDVRVEDGWRAVERQWLIALDASEVSHLDQPGIHIIDHTPLSELGLNLVRFRVTDALNTHNALASLLPASLVDRLDRNHIYSPQSGSSSSQETGQSMNPGSCDKPVVIGMVDTAIQTDHPSFSNTHIVQKSFLDNLHEPTDHGTAVASLLVGKLPDQPTQLLPQATLVNASVFYNREDLSSGATLMHLVEGLNWLVSQEVSLINISMAGPDNRLLAMVTERLNDAGIPLIAAVGNHGPAAPALYPAAYSYVVGVTAVDASHQVYRWANQGDQVDFAAYGVDVVLAGSNNSYGRHSGTSMATPLVTARMACSMAIAPAPVAELIKRLASQAIDLGEAGRDPVFGYGLLGWD